MGWTAAAYGHLGEEKEYCPSEQCSRNYSSESLEIWNLFPILFLHTEEKKQLPCGTWGKHSISLNLDSFHLLSGLLNISSTVVILRTSWALTHFLISASCFVLLNFLFPIPGGWGKCFSSLILKFITESPLLRCYHALRGQIAFTAGLTNSINSNKWRDKVLFNRNLLVRLRKPLRSLDKTSG